jgi:F-type H+-transporting ATPase subunit delta
VGELAAIVESFELLLDERLGFVRAYVTSATELSAAQRASLEAELSRLSGKTAKLRFSTDPALVGGAVARVGSRSYDGSVRGQLQRLRARLVSH